jgi:hypothetical protein
MRNQNTLQIQLKDLAPCRNKVIQFSHNVRQFGQRHHKNQHYCKHGIYVNSVSMVNIPSRQPLYGPTPINAHAHAHVCLLDQFHCREVAPCACLLVGPVSLPRVPSFIVPTSHNRGRYSLHIPFGKGSKSIQPCCTFRVREG